MGIGTETEAMGLRLAMRRLLRRRTSLTPALPRDGRPRLPDRLSGEQFPGSEVGGASEVGLRCTACALCMAACPSACIRVEAGPRSSTRVVASKGAASGDRTASSFFIDLGRCTLCGLCAQACPVDAIRLDGRLPAWASNRDALVLDLDALRRA